MKRKILQALIIAIISSLLIFQTSVYAIVSPTDKFSDMNGDGMISSIDALIILQAASKMITLSPELQEKADVNSDGRVTPLDALMLIRSVQIAL